MRNTRIVIIDDEEVILVTFEKILKKNGYEIVTYGAPEFCKIYREDINSCPYDNPCTDILISDYFLPQMTGLRLFEIQSQKGCPIHKENKLLMSGYSHIRYFDQLKELGCSFFEKPINLSELLEWLQKCKKNIDLSTPLQSL